jgi:hypothetical protein
MDRLEWYRFKTNNNLFSAAACAPPPPFESRSFKFPGAERDLSPDANQRILNDKIIPI